MQDCTSTMLALYLVPTAILQPDPYFHLHAVALDALRCAVLLGAARRCSALLCPLPWPGLLVPCQEKAVWSGRHGETTMTATMALPPR